MSKDNYPSIFSRQMAANVYVVYTGSPWTGGHRSPLFCGDMSTCTSLKNFALLKGQLNQNLDTSFKFKCGHLV